MYVYTYILRFHYMYTDCLQILRMKASNQNFTIPFNTAISITATTTITTTTTTSVIDDAVSSSSVSQKSTGYRKKCMCISRWYSLRA